MTTIDRIIFGVIAAALVLITLQPFVADATKEIQDVNIRRVGGYAIGPELPIKAK